MEEKEKPIYPSAEQFQHLSVEDKVGIFTHLPISAQKLLVGCGAFASSVRPEMAQPVSKLAPEEFEEAKITLSNTPYFSVIENGRLQVVDPMREFINGDLKRLWEGQQKAKDKG